MKNRKYQVEATLTVIRGEDEAEIEVTIIGTYYLGLKGRRHLANGDPGYPDEPSEADLLHAYVNGVEFELTDLEVDKAIEALIEKAEEPQYEDEEG